MEQVYLRTWPDVLRPRCTYMHCSCFNAALYRAFFSLIVPNDWGYGSAKPRNLHFGAMLCPTLLFQSYDSL
jgi:hypothetical protein